MQSPSEAKIALITGGSSGIGLALARQLVQSGRHVWLAARRAEQLQQAVAALEACRRREDQVIGYSACDVTVMGQVEGAVAEATARLGAPDLVINSAGFAHPGYFHELDLDIFHQTMSVNYFGTLNVIRAVLPGMRARHSGQIINIASESGFIGLFGYTAYSASKYAVAGFSDALRPELKDMGIRLSVVYPPDVDTPQLAYETPLQPPELRALAPLRSVMSADRLAKIILAEAGRGKYMILPGFDAKLMYFLVRLLGRGFYPALDRVTGVLGNIERRKDHKGVNLREEVK
jgi:3-dehydrosphinganine reductase